MNINKYKSILLNALVICDKNEQTLNLINKSTYFKPIEDITKDLIMNTRNAFIQTI